MKISRIQAFQIDLPMKEGSYSWSTQSHSSFDSTVVIIETDEGISGIGLGGGMTDDGAVFQAIAEQSKPIVVGQDPLRNEKICDDLWQPKLVGRRGLTTRVISAIDNALWDV